MEPNFYERLGVDPQADEHTLKSAFRQFAKKYHPDKVAREGNDSERADEVFMAFRNAFEALKNPVVRFAYDRSVVGGGYSITFNRVHIFFGGRFGPDVLTWTQCTTAREYMQRGLLKSSGYHIVTGLALLFWSAIGQPSPAAFVSCLLCDHHMQRNFEFQVAIPHFRLFSRIRSLSHHHTFTLTRECKRAFHRPHSST